MISNGAIQSAKALNDLEIEANAVLEDPSTKDMKQMSSMKDVQSIVANAKKYEMALSGILAQIQRFTHMQASV